MRGAHPERDLDARIRREGVVRHGEAILVACSGGPDSVALAAGLAAVAPAMELRLALAHVNHGTRASAWQDEAVALRVGAALGLPVHVSALDLAGGDDEAALRSARYAALAQSARRHGCAAVATGHHAGDQAETVVLALFRGTGNAGLAGMPARRRLEPGVDLVRPLLGVERGELLAYLGASGLPYAVDPTNARTEYRRNAVRAALAMLRPHFPGLDAAVARAAAIAAAEAESSPLAGARRQVREALREHQALDGVSFEHVDAAARALVERRAGRFFLAPGIEAAIENGTLTVDRIR